ncbi:DUF4144 domain-containing protein [Shewanella eurypsychrophilus]|uniref:DUF4144 domain-containing protein n=1 Tax=Shewanella eurypsychrophilus TaxID=2593656 RepID=A0ABX6V3V3_9GAMM|nr:MULTISPECIES: DUF4144 family protein [Shewanella]QFU21363.1 hypothetical protein FS418_05435 [Shewanella sp. YLB-09]QPG56653.1 DUF4144 domain-containing protein [Shewanella eurypsychrophilus]
MTSEANSQIIWPAILIQEGQTELLYLESSNDWLEQAQGHIDASCRLLDSCGSTYLLNQQNWGLSTLNISMTELIELVRLHASTLGHCCTAKMGADTLEQVFNIMKHLEES